MTWNQRISFEPGNFIFKVRMTDDVMSDCVGGDYAIEKIPKNDAIY